MNEQERQELKTLVGDRIDHLEELVIHNGSIAEKKHEHSDDQAACLDLNINSAVESQLLDSAKKELRLLKRNLRWLDSEDAGYCDECGCDIPVARVKAVPSTRLCVACAENKGE